MTMIELIISATALVINSYVIYKVIQSYTTAKQAERTLKSSQHCEWLYSMGLYETATKFNEWAQLIERQIKQRDYDFQKSNIKWYV